MLSGGFDNAFNWSMLTLEKALGEDGFFAFYNHLKEIGEMCYRGQKQCGVIPTFQRYWDFVNSDNRSLLWFVMKPLCSQSGVKYNVEEDVTRFIHGRVLTGWVDARREESN